MFSIRLLPKLQRLRTAAGFNAEKVHANAKALCDLYTDSQVLVTAEQNRIAYRAIAGELNKVCDQ